MARDVIKTVKHGRGEIDCMDDLRFRARFTPDDPTDCAYTDSRAAAEALIDARDKAAQSEGSKLDHRVIAFPKSGNAHVTITVRGVHGRSGDALTTPPKFEANKYAPIVPDTPALRARMDHYAGILYEIDVLQAAAKSVRDELEPYTLNLHIAFGGYGRDLEPGTIIEAAQRFAASYADKSTAAEKAYGAK